ncbi:MAG: dTMP kinase, partial [Armatimonadota bacterium]
MTHSPEPGSEKSRPAQGCFIVLDGIDGCGKSTQATLVEKALADRGMDVVLTREPGGTRIGRRIRQVLLDPETGDTDPLTEALLFCADRAEDVNSLIRPALQEGKIVVCDRFASATAVYQGYAGELGFELANTLNDIATRGLAPNLLIILDIDFENARNRLQETGREADRMERNSRDYFERVREGFIKYAETHATSAVIVNANRPIETVHKEIMAVVNRVL